MQIEHSREASGVSPLVVRKHRVLPSVASMQVDRSRAVGGQPGGGVSPREEALRAVVAYRARAAQLRAALDLGGNDASLVAERAAAAWEAFLIAYVRAEKASVRQHSERLAGLRQAGLPGELQRAAGGGVS